MQYPLFFLSTTLQTAYIFQYINFKKQMPQIHIFCFLSFYDFCFLSYYVFLNIETLLLLFLGVWTWADSLILFVPTFLPNTLQRIFLPLRAFRWIKLLREYLTQSNHNLLLLFLLLLYCYSNNNHYCYFHE